MLQTCLYDRGTVDLKEMLRSGASDDAIQNVIIQAVRNKAVDGFEAQKRSVQLYNLSMAQIGG
jgi:cyclic pyranopterin phosphate synthase